MTAASLAAVPLLAALIVADGPGIDLAQIQAVNAKVETVTWRGAPAIKVVQDEMTQDGALHLKDVAFHNGTIEVDVAGLPGARAAETARGFIGVRFRVQPDGTRMETFYVRPTNGRADDQLRRNHAVQYTSEPDWPWHRLRKETPGLYETYADMEAGEWLRLKIVVRGTRAQIYVGGATQPTMLVNDLKLGDVSGGVALFVGPGTDGYFRNLKITPA